MSEEVISLEISQTMVSTMVASMIYLTRRLINKEKKTKSKPKKRLETKLLMSLWLCSKNTSTVLPKLRREQRTDLRLQFTERKKKRRKNQRKKPLLMTAKVLKVRALNLDQ